MTTVLFVCVHNAGRSQMAAALLRKHAGDHVEVLSAGSAPADEVNPAVVEVMREIGIDLVAERPKLLSSDAVQASDVVITMGCGDACPIFPGKRYLDWQLDDPAGKGAAAVRPIRDDIDRRVRQLVAELVPSVTAMTGAHAERVLAIYQAGLDTGESSLETTAPDWPTWDANHLEAHRYVAVAGDTVLGWAALSQVSLRCVYGGVAEVSVYVDPSAHRRGVGRALLHAVIDSSEAAGIWTLQAGIFPTNQASVRLHTRAGFRVVGTRERLGQHRGVWRDVLLLERRSSLAGLG